MIDLLECPFCLHDSVLPAVIAPCSAHESEWYRDQAQRAIAHELTYSARSFEEAITRSRHAVAVYAGFYQADVDKLRSAIAAEATRRGIAA